MATPIAEDIAVALAALIDGITVANGFNEDLTSKRPKRLDLRGDLYKDGLCIIEQEDATVEAASREATMLAQAYTLQVILLDSDDATATIDTRVNQVAADIIKQLFGSGNFTLGGLAAGMRLRDPCIEKFIATAEASGVAVNIDVLYTIASDNPYNQA
jgi:hypothetical protein